MAAIALVVTASLVSSMTPLKAELWNPLDAVPKPNAVVGLDSSVTMGIDTSCNNCHGPGNPDTRLEIVKTAINASLPMFADYFLFGGFEYSGCGYAKVESRAVPPNPDDPAASLAAVTSLIDGAQHCMSRERYFPSMSEPVSTGCATTDCSGDVGIIMALLNGALKDDGFDPGAIWRVKGCSGSNDACALWPPNPPWIDPPDPPPEYCPCVDGPCHIGGSGGGWIVTGGCSPPGGSGNCNAIGCCGAVECTDQGCVAYLTSDEVNFTLCVPQPPPNPPYNPYPCWGTGGTPMMNRDPDLACVLSNPDYPQYINAPMCESDPFEGGNYCISDIIRCNGGLGGAISVKAVLQAELANFEFPRWYPRTLTAAQVQEDFCNPLRDAVRVARAAALACNGGELVVPLNPDAPDFCDPGLLKDTICAAGSPFAGTCVCDDTDPACSTLTPSSSDCGTPLDFKARQQVAVCETYHPDHLRPYYLNQPDNRVNGGCRENMTMLFTDGYMGQTAGVASEAASARLYYETPEDESNMFVFRVSDVFESDANALASAFQQVAPFDATSIDAIQGSLVRVRNRAYRGVYVGNSPGVGTFGTTMAIHSFTVPGAGGVSPGDDYFGFPARISLFRVEHTTGALVGPPLFETDWAEKVDGVSSCGPNTIGGTDVAKLGPGGNFRNGTARWVNVPANTVDRDGDDIAGDSHPPLKWGNHFSIGSTQPVIVEGPRDSLTAKYADFTATRDRPRAVYTISNGYVLGYYGGTKNGILALYGDQKMSYGYSIDAEAGREILRYRPGWLEGSGGDYQYDLNDLIQQPIMTGELAAQEVVFEEGTAAAQAHTVLVGTQGKTGRGVFALDITNPCSPTLLGEWTLPGATDRASAEPHLGVMLKGGVRHPTLFITGGLGGTPTLYAFRIQNGSLLSSIALPAGSYPTAPACADVTGEGRTTHCYVLSEEGRLVRVGLDANGFAGYADITPAGIAGGRFGVAPVAFANLNGEVSIVFGSGNFEDFDKPDAANHLYKVVDTASRVVGFPAGAANLASACKTLGSGVINLAAGERIISRAVVSDEVVAWTAFRPSMTGCNAGETTLYAMDFETCENLLVPNPGQPPQPVPVGDGFATTPILHRESKSLVVATSAAPTASQVDGVSVRVPDGSQVIKKVSFREWTDSR